MSLKRVIIVLLRWTLCIGVVVGLSFVGYTAYTILSYNHVPLDEGDLGISADKDVATSQSDSQIQEPEIVNIALFGLDARYEYEVESARSDAVMVVSVNLTDKDVKISSLMRDSQITIEGYGTDKLNHAYAYGGPQLSVKTINQNFDMDIKDYVSVDFAGLIDIIDFFGGIEVDLSSAERTAANEIMRNLKLENGTDYERINSSGLQTLNGDQAVAYSRIRSVGDDWERVERQQYVLSELMRKFGEMNPLDYPSLIAEVIPFVETSLTPDEILSLATGILSSGMPEITSTNFPQTEDVYSSGTYIKYNKDATLNKLHAFIYDGIPVDMLNVLISDASSDEDDD